MATTKTLAPEMRQALQKVADADGFIELPDFINIALYHPALGYYAQQRRRVGRDRHSDFFTSTSFREAFAEIVAEAAEGIARDAGLNPTDLRWLELGAEPEQTLLAETHGSFHSRQALALGDSLELKGQLAVFSNELFDAQPFRQIRYHSGQWVEYGVQISPDGLGWRARPEPSAEAAPWLERLPASAAEGYTVDLPTGAARLVRQLLAQDWTGVFIAFDYGKSWAALVDETPQGTARSYRQHKMLENILADPGHQDITCHICWDDLKSALADHGFDRLSLQSQESFIARRAPRFLEKVFDPSRGSLDPLRSKLKELMHPALMGQKFQALSGVRAGKSPFEALP